MLAADDLVCLWEGGLPQRIAYGLSGIRGSEEIARRAIGGTAVFLRAYAASPGTAPTGSCAAANTTRSISAGWDDNFPNHDVIYIDVGSHQD